MSTVFVPILIALHEYGKSVGMLFFYEYLAQAECIYGEKASPVTMQSLVNDKY